jgi:hypothetical protein
MTRGLKPWPGMAYAVVECRGRIAPTAKTRALAQIVAQVVGQARMPQAAQRLFF